MPSAVCDGVELSDTNAYSLWLDVLPRWNAFWFCRLEEFADGSHRILRCEKWVVDVSFTRTATLADLPLFCNRGKVVTGGSLATLLILPAG